MKLSIQNIYDRVATTDSYLVGNEVILFNLLGVRCYPGTSSKLSKDLLYIIKADQLLAFTTNTNLNFICLGNIDNSLIKDKWSIIVMPSNEDEDRLLEKVQSVFEEYNLWIEDINSAIFEGDSLQSILDKSSIYLKNPVALFDNSHGLLMKTSNIIGNDLDSIWSYVLEKGHSFKETEENFLTHKISTSHKPFYYKSPDIHGDITRLIAPIMVKDSYFGVLAMTELINPLSKSEYANLCLVQGIIENALKVNDEYFSYSDAPWYLYRLLTEKHVDHSIVSHHLGLLGKKAEEKYFLWCFSPTENSNNIDFSIQSYLQHISKLIESGIAFCHENMILVCDYNLSNYRDTHFTTKILEYLDRTGFRASISMVFNNIFEISHAFYQCQISNEYSGQKNALISSFNEVYSDYILSAIEKNTKLDILVIPEIRNLHPNEPYNRELLLCLQTFVINGKNITATAKDLNIHRHTVVYRLNNINKITGIDFECLNEDAMFQLYFSCKILLKNPLFNTTHQG